jgi:hypothetical protein
VAAPLIPFDRLGLPLDRHLDAIELDNRGHIRDRFVMGLLQERLDLMDAFIDSPQAHTTAQRGTPPFAETRADFGTSQCQRARLDPNPAKNA